MRKIERNGVHKGWQIGEELISIHKHINNPDYWLLSSSNLGISKRTLCKIGASEKEILALVLVLLDNRRKAIMKAMLEVQNSIDLLHNDPNAEING